MVDAEGRARCYVHRLNGIYERNLAHRKIQLARGHARISGTHSVEIDDWHATAPHIVVATGGYPVVPALPGAELGITSDGFFELEQRRRVSPSLAVATSR